MNLTTAINRDYQVSRCSRNHSLSASFMRVCQPLPVALKASSTSASKRTVVETLVGDFCLPRPDNLIFSDSGNSENGLNNAGSTFDKSPTSPSLSISGNRETMGSSFSFVSFAKTDDTNAALSLAERQHMQPTIQVADGDKARFRVFNARVLPDFRGLKIKIDRAFKAQAAFSDVFGVLGGIEFNYHEFIVITNSKMHKYFVTTFDKPSIRAYPSRTTDTSVVGIGVLEAAANGRHVQALRLFLCLIHPFMGGRAERAEMLAGAAPVRQSPFGRPPYWRRDERLKNRLRRYIMTNTPLVPVFTGTISNQSIQLCNARDLHHFLESGREFATWIKNRIEQYGFIAGEDYLTNLSNRSDGKAGRGRTEYHLTLDMAKELAMVENNEKGREIRRYFISLERSGKHALPDQSSITADQIEKLIQKQLQKSLPVNMAHDCLLPPQQAKEITDRLNRLASMFHPFSDQFLDVMGVIRALHGRNPKLGLEQPGYRKVMTSTLK
jgi:phage anti-repressor protein